MINICIVGAEGSGKTTMIQSFLSGKTPDKAIPTLGFDTFIDKTKNRNYTDISGKRKCISLISQHITDDLFIICVDLSKPFKSSVIDDYLEQLLTTETPILFVGCKQDIAYKDTIEALRLYIEMLGFDLDTSFALSSKHLLKLWSSNLEKNISRKLVNLVSINDNMFFNPGNNTRQCSFQIVASQFTI